MALNPDDLAAGPDTLPAGNAQFISHLESLRRLYPQLLGQLLENLRFRRFGEQKLSTMNLRSSKTRSVAVSLPVHLLLRMAG